MGLSNLFVAIKEIDFLRMLTSIFLGMIGAILILILVHFMSSPPIKIGTVNITQLINRYIKLEAQKNVSPEELKKEVRTYGNRLNKELQIFSAKNHVVLFPSEAIIAGGKDYTSYIGAKMQSFYQVNAE